MATPPPRERLRPWLWLNLKIGALSFGASGRALLYREALVTDRDWIKDDEFNETMTVAQILPGPNLVNLCLYMGFRLTGWKGAILGCLLLTLPGALMLVALYEVLGAEHPGFDVFFNGVSVGAITLFIILIWRMSSGLSAMARETLAPKLKIAARFAIAALIATCSLLHVGIFSMLGIGAALGLICEFTL